MGRYFSSISFFISLFVGTREGAVVVCGGIVVVVMMGADSVVVRIGVVSVTGVVWVGA